MGDAFVKKKKSKSKVFLTCLIYTRRHSPTIATYCYLHKNRNYVTELHNAGFSCTEIFQLLLASAYAWEVTGQHSNNVQTIKRRKTSLDRRRKWNRLSFSLSCHIWLVPLRSGRGRSQTCPDKNTYWNNTAPSRVGWPHLGAGEWPPQGSRAVAELREKSSGGM